VKKATYRTIVQMHADQSRIRISEGKSREEGIFIALAPKAGGSFARQGRSRPFQKHAAAAP
jgi:hypothetical protein